MINIIQQPYSLVQPASTPTVYTATAPSIVLLQSQVKFICEVYVMRTFAPIASSFPVATLKTSPNRRGSGIFDISPVIEAYVSAQHEGREGITTQNPNQSSSFKGVDFRNDKPHPIHCIDKFCTNTSNMVWYVLRFRIEYLNTITDRVETYEQFDKETTLRLVYNGVLTNTNPISYYNKWQWYDMQDINYEDGSGDYFIRGSAGSTTMGKFITNMPYNRKQPMGENDYGTIAFFNCINNGYTQTNPANAPQCNIPYIILEFYNSAGTQIQSFCYWNVPVNGGKGNYTSDLDASAYWIYFGHGLANHKGRGGTIPVNAVGYKVYASDTDKPDEETGIYPAISRKYDFEIIKDDCRGYESVRLAWQNRMGAWDYYTFNLQSKKTVKTKGKNYQQLSGTWNEEIWRPKDHLGGQKVFNNVAVENWTLNSDYMHEDTAAWLEELFTSSQVYVVNKFYSDNPTMGFTRAKYIHKYIEPVTIKSSLYTKKTRANDGLIQYSIKIEKSKRLNIQRA